MIASLRAIMAPAVFWILSVLLLFSMCKAFQLTLLHTNDFHARFESFSCAGRSKKCGGVSRLLTAVSMSRSQHPNALLLDAGDQFQGTFWYSVLKWKPYIPVLALFNYDSMTFGNHDFDDGVEGLVDFVTNLSFPIVSSNVDPGNSRLKGTYSKYKIIDSSGQKIGIIGCTTTSTPFIANPGPELSFGDEILAFKEVIAELQGKGVNKIVALSHSGLLKDYEFCQKVQGLDIIIGGHTHSFMYTGSPAPDDEDPVDVYPRVFTDTGAPCLVVQAFAFSKYLGFLQVDFDASGVPTSWAGNPILVDDVAFPENETMNDLLLPFQKELEGIKTEVVGIAATRLDGNRLSCRLKECNLGNLVADALVHGFFHHPFVQTNSWTNVALGLINSGGVRDFQTDQSNEEITLADLITVLPFENIVENIQLKGKHILAAFEHSVSGYNKTNPDGKFLQVSGFQVLYNLSQPDGERVVQLLAKCQNCLIPVFEPLDEEKIYNVTTWNFIFDRGGDGYSMIKDNIIRRDFAGFLDVDLLKQFIKQNQPIVAAEEGRIQFTNETQTQKNCSQVPTEMTPCFSDACSRFYYFYYGAFAESFWHPESLEFDDETLREEPVDEEEGFGW